MSAATRRRAVQAAAPRSRASHALAGELLSYFYPIRYRVGIDLEMLMCQGRIARKQAAILWLIHSRADARGWVRRKEIETRLSAWFEITNSNISKLLRDLAKPPGSLVEQVENPDSGREKLVRLTKAGESFVAGMTEASADYLAQHLAHLSTQEFRWGIDFFALAFYPPARAADGADDVLRLPPPPGRIAGASERRRRGASRA